MIDQKFIEEYILDDNLMLKYKILEEYLKNFQNFKLLRNV